MSDELKSQIKELVYVAVTEALTDAMRSEELEDAINSTYEQIATNSYAEIDIQRNEVNICFGDHTNGAAEPRYVRLPLDISVEDYSSAYRQHEGLATAQIKAVDDLIRRLQDVRSQLTSGKSLRMSKAPFRARPKDDGEDDLSDMD